MYGQKKKKLFGYLRIFIFRWFIHLRSQVGTPEHWLPKCNLTPVFSKAVAGYRCDDRKVTKMTPYWVGFSHYKTELDVNREKLGRRQYA